VCGGVNWSAWPGPTPVSTTGSCGSIRRWGALHEVGGQLCLGAPKSTDSAPDIVIPPFLIGVLRKVLDGHDGEQVFTGERGGLLRRSTFNRRMWQPAVNGDARLGRAAVRA